MGIVAWLTLGAIVGYVVGLIAEGADGLGVAASVALGIIGAVIGGLLAASVLGIGDPIAGPLDLGALFLATAAAALTVALVDRFVERDRLRV